MTDACAYLLANMELKKFRYFRNLDIDFVFMTKYAVFIYPCNLKSIFSCFSRKK